MAEMKVTSSRISLTNLSTFKNPISRYLPSPKNF
jgi:hypothetical protein